MATFKQCVIYCAKSPLITTGRLKNNLLFVSHFFFLFVRCCYWLMKYLTWIWQVFTMAKSYSVSFNAEWPLEQPYQFCAISVACRSKHSSFFLFDDYVCVIWRQMKRFTFFWNLIQVWKFSFNIWRTLVFYWGHWYPCLDFWWRLLRVSKPERAALFTLDRDIHVRCSLRFTSGAPPADLLAASMSAELISST